ncbi:MAG: crosslink repair DNA glycosylase YcaQ family protein, partial [Chloroflexota bacterium]
AGRFMLRRYLHAYGPAGPEHVARWLGGKPAWVNDLFTREAGLLEQVDVEGEELWQLAGDEARPATEQGTIRLLPYFDAYAVGCHPREHVFPGRAGERALARTQAGNLPVLLADGVVIGIWHQRRSGRKLALTVEPFRDLTSRERGELDDQVARLAEIQEATATMTIGTVTIGPHA